MPVKTSPYDVADYLDSQEDIQAYLDAVLEEAGDDPRLIVHALANITRTKNMSRIARESGISREGLYKALSEEGNPSFATVAKIARALGLKIRFQSAA